MNAIQILKEDHKKLRGLLAELNATTTRAWKRRSELLSIIAKQIEAHTALEEEIFYPALKRAGESSDDEKMYFEALEEHRAAGDMLLPDLLRTSPDSNQFGGRAKVLKELIEHHAAEEEIEMFPRVRQLLTAAELRALGELMIERRRELAAGPSTLGAVKRASDRLMGAIALAMTPEEEAGARPHQGKGDGHRSGRRISASKGSHA